MVGQIALYNKEHQTIKIVPEIHQCDIKSIKGTSNLIGMVDANHHFYSWSIRSNLQMRHRRPILEDFVGKLKHYDVGNGHFGVVSEDGTLFLKGHNAFGCCGLSGQNAYSNFVKHPFFGGNIKASKVACGIAQTMVLDEEGNVWMCGRGSRSLSMDATKENLEKEELYHNENSQRSFLMVHGVEDPIIDIQSSQINILLSSTGKIFTFGFKEAKLLGRNGILAFRRIPKPIDYEDKFTNVWTANQFTVAMNEENELIVWGNLNENDILQSCSSNSFFYKLHFPNIAEGESQPLLANRVSVYDKGLYVNSISNIFYRVDLLLGNITTLKLHQGVEHCLSLPCMKHSLFVLGHQLPDSQYEAISHMFDTPPPTNSNIPIQRLLLPLNIPKVNAPLDHINQLKPYLTGGRLYKDCFDLDGLLETCKALKLDQLVQQINDSTKIQPYPLSSIFKDHLDNLQQQKQLDSYQCTLTSNGFSIRVDKNLLSAQSLYFKRLFSTLYSDHHKKTFHFSFTKDAMMFIINYMYLQPNEDAEDLDTLIERVLISQYFELPVLQASLELDLLQYLSHFKNDPILDQLLCTFESYGLKRLVTRFNSF